MQARTGHGRGHARKPECPHTSTFMHTPTGLHPSTQAPNHPSTHTRICTQARTRPNTRSFARTLALDRACPHAGTHKHTRMHLHVHARTHSRRTHTHACTSRHARTRAHAHTRAHNHTRTTARSPDIYTHSAALHASDSLHHCAPCSPHRTALLKMPAPLRLRAPQAHSRTGRSQAHARTHAQVHINAGPRPCLRPRSLPQPVLQTPTPTVALSSRPVPKPSQAQAASGP